LVIEFCTRCGQTCGQADFLTISACGGSACIAGVSRDCGHCIFRLEGGATRSQNQARYQLRYTRIFGFVGGESLCGAVCTGDAACKATAWSIDSADGVCAGRCGGDNAYPTMFCGKKQQGAGRFSAGTLFCVASKRALRSCVP
jgi:hypothetical protein